MNSQRFTERLCYNSAVEGLSPVLEHEYRYDGTVSAYACHVAGETFQRGYTLMYDGLRKFSRAPRTLLSFVSSRPHTSM